MEGVHFKCANKIEFEKILKEMHEGVCGGHYIAKTIAHKILRASFWWPTLLKDVQEFVKMCHACQRFGGKLKFSRNLPLIHVEV